ncbi:MULTISPECIES: ABC transporter substrate-binding protein [Bacillaceae]|uniref:ABC transporter substrate-binding protein n=1 Tax=Evansella alkalicola TaxID=745819 RepID=A0ABS6JWS7_9BACI|nr:MULTISPECIES: ABC transporter substrate-binding protein [Bacillaceae]MBU9723021.1 ABC transporter substrate-binding protein [Bacillus alkalicola]
MKSDFKIGQLIKVAAIAILLGILLIACSSEEPAESDVEDGDSTTNESSTDTDDSSDEISDDPSSKHGGTLRIVFGGAIAELGYPPAVRSMTSVVAMQPATETLAKFNEAGEAIPWLAEGWEKDAEQNTVTVEVKQGVQFHDGTDLDAEAVKWNLENFRDAGRVEAAVIDSVEVLDEYRLQINLSRWDQSIQDNLFGFMGITSPTAFQEHGEEWLRDNPVGTGPYVFKEWIKDEKIVFERNDNYWMEDKPYLDGIEIHSVTEPATAEASMIAGDFDLYLYLSPQSASNLEGDFQIEMLENGFGAIGYSLSPDSENPDSPLADPIVRKAISYAIDKQAIVDTIYYGYGEATDQYSVEAGMTFSPSVEGTPFDPEKAAELLEEAGYGEGLEITLTYADSPNLSLMYTSIQAYLNDVGVDVHLNPVQDSQWAEMTGSEGSWEGLIHTTFRVSNDVIFDFNRSMTSDSSHYRHTMLSAEAEDLIAESAQITDSEEYMDISHELQRMIFDDYQTVIPIMVEGQVLAQTGKVHDHGLMKTQITTWTPESIWME